MRTFQSALDITANNMANVNTTAYKAERGAFQDLLYTQMDVKSGELLTGHGVKTVSYTHLVYLNLLQKETLHLKRIMSKQWVTRKRRGK